LPHTLVAFDENYTAAATLDAMTAVSDPHVRVAGDDIWIPDPLPYLGGYIALGATLTAARIESPTLRTLTPIDVAPLDLAAEPSTPAAYVDLKGNPKLIGAGEALNFRATVTGAARCLGLAVLCDGPIAPVAGEIFTIKATAAATLVANAWTNAALTFAQSLPHGTYQVVGMRAQSAGLIAARLVFPGYAWRPGCLGADAYSDLVHEAFRGGKLGVWGSFEHDVPPTVDFLSISADTSEEVWLDLIKVA